MICLAQNGLLKNGFLTRFFLGDNRLVTDNEYRDKSRSASVIQFTAQTCRCVATSIEMAAPV